MPDLELASQRNFFIERATSIQDFNLTIAVAIATIAASIDQEAYERNPYILLLGYSSIAVGIGLTNARRARMFIDHAKIIDDHIINEHLRAETIVTSTRRSLFFGSNLGLAVLWMIALIIVLYRISSG